MDTTPELVNVNGRAHWRFGDKLLPLVRGGDGPDDGDGSGDGDGDGDDESSDDDETVKPGDEDEDGDDSGSDSESRGGNLSLESIVEAVVPAIEKSWESRIEREADRRATKLSNRIKQLEDKANGKSGDKPSDKDGAPPRTEPTVDVREARREVRSALDDFVPTGKFLGPEEKAWARELASALVEVEASSGDWKDEDKLARDVAQRVAEMVKKARKESHRASKDQFQRSGQLKDAPDGQPPRGRGAPDPASAVARGSSHAKRIYGKTRAEQDAAKAAAS